MNINFVSGIPFFLKGGSHELEGSGFKFVAGCAVPGFVFFLIVLVLVIGAGFVVASSAGKYGEGHQSQQFQIDKSLHNDN